MKIVIVGLGIVGGAHKFAFEKLGHEVRFHDPKIDGSLTYQELRDWRPSAYYICVPTPMKKDGSCDTSIVEGVVKEIHLVDTFATVVIKSTVTPGTTAKLQREYSTLRLAFSAEFLRERCATTDMVENNKLLLVGVANNRSGKITFDEIVSHHGKYPQNVMMVSSTQAELAKYYHNTINALRVVFANEMYDICNKLGQGYTSVKEAVLLSTGLPDIYLDVNENMRGYSSICWNKDVPALLALCDELGLDVPLLRQIPKSNDNYKKTPFNGTREDYGNG
jgi:UDPglucose 6-dehydrogenase